MSGIAAIINFDGAPVEPGLIEKMTAALAYRGPDGIGHWVHGPVALGHCMLRTTQESLEENQPLANEDETLILIMDGWLSNWEELRGELLAKRMTLRTRSDAELALRAYELWGKDCLSRLEGDFALLIRDQARHEAFCARDRTGMKPFHYRWDGRRLIVASDLHAILGVPGVSQEPNNGMISEVLAWEWHSRDETVWQGIMRLPAAHCMVATGGGLRIARYWWPRLDSRFPYKRDEEYIEHYRELFADCVRRSSRTHRTAAYEVSGGLDSSAVFCMAEQLRKAGRLPAPAIKGYTASFDGYSDAGEIEYARAAGLHSGSKVEEVQPFIPDLSWFEDGAKEFRDLPGFPNAAAFINLKKAMASDGSRIFLNGQGGDEWVGGSRLYYAEQIAAGQLAGLWRSFRADLAAAGPRQSLRWFAGHGPLQFLTPKARKTVKSLLLPWRRANADPGAYWLSPQMRAALEERRSNADTSLLSERNVARRVLRSCLDAAFAAHIREQVERMTSHCGLERRSPLFDQRFIDFAFVTPERLRLRGNTNKYIHLQALIDVLPISITNRRTKASFSSLFLKQVDRMREDFTRRIPLERETWVSAEGMEKLYRAYRLNPAPRVEVYPTPGVALWSLWGIYQCDCVFK